MSISRTMTCFSFSISSAGKRGVLHDVAENIDGDPRAGVGDVDVINRAVEGGVGVHVTAGFLHFLVDAAAGARGRAFEKHVLQHVRHAGAEPFAFVNAAGHAPGLGGNHRRAVVFADDDGQAVFERRQFDPRRDGGDGGAIMFGERGHRVLQQTS